MSRIRNNRVVQSFVAAALAVAIIFAGLTGTASAMPAQQGGTANVMISMPASVGQFDQSPSQSWVSLFRLADHKAYTGTVQTATAATKIGDPGNHTANYRGNREFVANGVEAGDYLLVAHLGASTLVMNKIVSVAMGDQYPNQTHVMTWTGSGTTGTTASTAKAKTGTTAKPAAPLGTAMCMVTATKATTTTGTATIVSGGVTWVGKAAFVPTNSTLLTVEAGAKLAKDSKAKVLDFTSVPDGTNMKLQSGDYQVYRLTTGEPMYLGYLEAQPKGSYVGVTATNGVCKTYDLKLLGAKAATTGSGLNLLAMLALAACVVGLVINNRRRFFPGTVSAS